MHGKDKEYFTVVYYETREKLNISIVEYLILDYLVFLKRLNYKEFTYKMAMNKLYLSKNTFKKYLFSLINKGFIEPRERKREMFNIDNNIIEDMSEKREKFFLIYHDKRKELKLTLTQFGFLSMVYSLSKKNKNQRAFMGKKNYKKYLGIRSDKNYYETINNLIDKGLILKKGVSVFMIPNNVFYFFAEHDYSLKKSFAGKGFELRNNIDENDLKTK